jgi:endonuclease-8
MPEGHTIHRLAKDLGTQLAGHRLDTSSPQGRFASGAATLNGATLESVDANGKHLFFHWTGQPHQLHVHLGLFGRFRKRPSPPPPPRGELRLRMVGPDATFDLSGPTACDLLTPDEADAIADRLGPDPLRRDAKPDDFVSRVCSSRAAIGTLLLNQAVIAGIGNVYRAEILFLAGVHPRRTGRSLSEDEAHTIWDLSVSQLRRGVRLNRIVTRDPEEVGQRSAGRIKKADRLYAYKRSTCRRCSGGLDRFELANRTTWACGTCQPEHGDRP